MALVTVIDQIQIQNNPTQGVLEDYRMIGGMGWVVDDIAARDAIPTGSRKSNMEVKVIDSGSGTKYYSLGVGLGNGDWTEVVLTGYIPTSEKGADSGVAPLDADGFIPAGHIKNLFLNDSFVVANEAAMLALTSLTGNFAIRTDTGDVYVKLNNNGPPSVIGDWSILSSPGVSTVNGLSGGVSIDFTTLLTWGSSSSQFETAVTNSTYAGVTDSAITTLQGRASALETDQHTHANKALLDTLTSAGDGLSYLGDDGNYVLLHTHANKTAIDKVVDDGAGGLYLADDGVYRSIFAAGGIPDAPADGNPYARKEAAWESITGSTILFGNGAVDAPSISFESDTDTGLYWTSGHVNIATNGVKRADFGTNIEFYQTVKATLNINGATAGSFALFGGSASSDTVPTIAPHSAWATTGIGGGDNNNLTIVSASVGAMKMTKASTFGYNWEVGGANEWTTAAFGATTRAANALRINDVGQAPVGAMSAGGGLLYVSGTSLFFYDDTGVATDLTTGGGSGAFTADVDTQITPTAAILLDHATNNEIAFDLSGTVNKAAGTSNWIFANVTTTTALGNFIDLQDDSVSIFKITAAGNITTAGTSAFSVDGGAASVGDMLTLTGTNQPNTRTIKLGVENIDTYLDHAQSSGDFEFRYNGSPIITFNSTQLVINPAGNATNPSLHWQGDADTGFFYGPTPGNMANTVAGVLSQHWDDTDTIFYEDDGTTTIFRLERDTGNVVIPTGDLFINTIKQNTGNLTLGDSAITGNIILQPGATNRNYAIGTLGSLVVSTATSGQNSVRITSTATNSSIFALAGTVVDSFDVVGAAGISGDTRGGDLTLTGGVGWNTGVTDGGDVILEGGDPNSTGVKGGVVAVDGMFLQSDKKVQILTKHATLSTAQVIAMGTTPHELVPAPASGKHISIISASAKLTHVTTAFTNGNVLELEINGVLLWSTGTAFIDNGATTTTLLQASWSGKPVIDDGGTNSALDITSSSVASAGGTSTIDVWVTYYIADSN